MKLRHQFLLAVAYALLGAAGLVLAIPPGYASPVFPAVGLALACVLKFGPSALPGIWAGSAVLNLSHALLSGTLSPVTALVAAVIASGSCVQAWSGSWLVNRWLGPTWRNMERERDVVRFLAIGGVLACTVAATISSKTLLATGVITEDEFFFTWWNWYVGDLLGVLIFAPMSWCFLNPKDPLWRERRRSMLTPILLTLGLVAMVFLGTAKWERQVQEQVLATDAQGIAKQVTARLIAHREVLSALNHFIEAIPDFSFAQFETFTRSTLQDNPDIFALSFNDLVSDEQRPEYEREMSSLSPAGPFRITERDSQDGLVPAARRPHYVSVRYIVPLAGNRPAIGYDIHSEPIRQDALERAMISKDMAVTAPIRLVQEQQSRVGILELHPVYLPDGQSGTRLRGFAVAVVKVDEMIGIATGGKVPEGLTFRLTDPQAPVGHDVLYRSYETADEAASPDWGAPLRMGDRDWLLSVSATGGYRQHHRPWVAWVVGVVGLLFAALLQTLILGMTGRTALFRRQSETLAANRAELLLAEKVFESSGEAIVVTDPSGIVVSTNPAFTQVTGYTAEEVRGQSMRILNSGRQPPEFYRDLWESLTSDHAWSGEIWNRRKNGEVYPELLKIAAVQGADDVTTHYVGTFSDISEQKAAQEQIEFMAYHDALTSLPNRMLGKDRADQAILHAQRHATMLALLFLDLDNFKQINDTYGHAVGDLLLQGVAQRLRQAVRAEDVLCRFAGDEFMIVLKDIPSQGAINTVCENILRHLAEPFDLENHLLQTSFSIGIARYPQDGRDSETLLRNADSALYEAKQAGRSTYRLFEGSIGH